MKAFSRFRSLTRSTVCCGAQVRRPWLSAEDQIIMEGVKRTGFKWRNIAALLPGRSDDAVRNRWNRLQAEPPDYIDADDLSAAAAQGQSQGRGQKESRCSHCGEPKRNHRCLVVPASSRTRRNGEQQRVCWTQDEDKTIRESVAALGQRWATIADKLDGRTEHGVRNRWHRLQVQDGAPLPANRASLRHSNPRVVSVHRTDLATTVRVQAAFLASVASEEDRNGAAAAAVRAQIIAAAQQVAVSQPAVADAGEMPQRIAKLLAPPP